jgi:hypothetical protein
MGGNEIMETLQWKVDEYEVNYSPEEVIIRKDGFFVVIYGKQSVELFDWFSDACTDWNVIDKYFDVFKEVESDYVCN